MLVIPFALSRDAYSIFVVLNEESLTRIRAYDPAEVTVSKMPEPWSVMHLRDVIIGFASEDEAVALGRASTEAERRALLMTLSRGFRYRPDRGDHDRGPERVHDERRESPL